MGGVSEKVTERRLRWYGHVMRRGGLFRKIGDGDKRASQKKVLPT